ncbi:MAG: hypothetical protein ACI8QZ_002468 [Chlamydiales bacterium]
MTEATANKTLIVSDVVSALTGTVDVPAEGTDLRGQMERAAEEFDKRTATAFGKALLDSLTEDPGNLRQLEALLILGLAHPDVLKKNRISLAVEGRRLGILLERAGEVERAQSVLELLSAHMPDERTIDHELAGLMRRSGNTDELVARYLQRADAFIAHGKVADAIPWLQEILLLDRSRRDVARMIRDLRYEEAERKVRSGRRNRLLLVLMLAATMITAVVYRELEVKREFGRMPTATGLEEEGVMVRLEAIQDFIASKRFWAGYFGATAECSKLQARLDELGQQAAARAAAEAIETQRTLEMANMSRVQAIQAVQRGEFALALATFRSCLEFDIPDWQYREQIEIDIQALVDHMEVSQ